ncbi:hypothetical protein ILYODFUR_038735 [Ilyodon furcidens]|uniref:Uncharacterized protein n=1 Tax=Ilyodon furcidens TaxID=33524 RepID=A0ABV0TTE1_9TELE
MQCGLSVELPSFLGEDLFFSVAQASRNASLMKIPTALQVLCFTKYRVSLMMSLVSQFCGPSQLNFNWIQLQLSHFFLIFRRRLIHRLSNAFHNNIRASHFPS